MLHSIVTWQCPDTECSAIFDLAISVNSIHYFSLFMASKVSTSVQLNRLYIAVLTPGVMSQTRSDWRGA